MSRLAAVSEVGGRLWSRVVGLQVGRPVSVRADVRLDVDGYGEAEPAALAQCALDPDASTLQLDQAPGEGQAEASARVAASRRALELLERLEDALLVLRRDARARVRDHDLDGSLQAMGRDVDPSALRSELHGVGEQVVQHLLEFALVRVNFAHG